MGPKELHVDLWFLCIFSTQKEKKLFVLDMSSGGSLTDADVASLAPLSSYWKTTRFSGGVACFWSFKWISWVQTRVHVIYRRDQEGKSALKMRVGCNGNTTQIFNRSHFKSGFLSKIKVKWNQTSHWTALNLSLGLSVSCSLPVSHSFILVYSGKHVHSLTAWLGLLPHPFSPPPP